MPISVKMKGFDNMLKITTKRKNVALGKNPKLFQNLNRQIWNSIHMNFTSSGRPHWLPRSDDKPWPILIKTGALMVRTLASVGRAWRKRGEGWKKVIYSPYYGFTHQYANSINTRIKERKYVKFTGSERKKILRTVLKALDNPK